MSPDYLLLYNGKLSHGSQKQFFLAPPNPINLHDTLHLHKQRDASVGHGVGQPQDATAHDGVAQVEDRHAKRGVALVLRRGRKIRKGIRKKYNKIISVLTEMKSDEGLADLRIRSHTSSCPGCVQGESSDSQRRCQCRDFKITEKKNQGKERHKHTQHRQTCKYLFF